MSISEEFTRGLHENEGHDMDRKFDWSRLSPEISYLRKNQFLVPV